MINIDQAGEALKNGCVFLGLQTDVEIVGLERDGRVILHYHQDPNLPDFGRHMIKLERWMKEYMKVKELELLLEPIEDKNRRDIKSGRIEKVTNLVSARNVESIT